MASPDNADIPQLLTLQEFSDLSRLSPATIHRLKRLGKIPFFQPSGPRGKLLFPTDAVEQAAQAIGGQTSPALSDAAKVKAYLSGPRPAWMRS